MVYYGDVYLYDNYLVGFKLLFTNINDIVGVTIPKNHILY